MSAYTKPIAQLAQQFHADLEHGLSPQQAASSLKEFGPNQLRAKQKKTMLQRFLEQFKDVMILILIAAAIISFFVAWQEQTGEYFEPLLILLIVLLNAVMGVIQESKAEKALEALQNLSAPHAKVIRNGAEQLLEATQVVPGDIILVEAGDYVPADARLLQSASLKAEESALTGESVASVKDAQAVIEADAPLGDRLNMIYAGCSIAYGRGKALVTATGMATEMGHIAHLLEQEQDTRTPLQHKLAKLGKYLGVLAIAICGVIFVIGMVSGMPWMEIFMTSVSLSVSAIPEGLPAIVTIVLSIGVQRMVKRNAIIRRLPAVETLGSASIICSDKTGTLTQNRMTLVKSYSGPETGLEEIQENNSPALRQLLQYAALCCDGSVVVEGDQITHIGDPTETAIVLAAQQKGMPKEALQQQFPRLFELPFDSDRKLMTVVCQMEAKTIVITKGAFDRLADLCTGGDLTTAGQMVDEMSRQALRVLAVGYKEIQQLPQTDAMAALESNLQFLGLVGMIDPPRPEVRQAVALCRNAGIKPVMITGDHVVTAAAIAQDLGIQQPGDQAITGQQLQAMTEQDLEQQVRNIAVYARVSPEDKIRIVKAWQKQGEIVSMTGDGVNDAPALKAADIGCAMGITGTDVAKGAADMTLTDDNFATIVEAVREGRGIYDNIRKTVGFLLGSNIGEVITVLTAMIFWRQSPLLSMQLLWINLVTDSLPAIALGMEAVEPDVMQRPPRPKTEGIFAHGLGVRIVLQGLLFAALTLFAFRFGWRTTGDLTAGRTMAFLVLAVSQVIHAFNMRSHRSLFRVKPFSNKYLNGAALLSFGLVVLIALVPALANIFGLTRLAPSFYLLALSLSLVPILILEATKAFGMVRSQK